MLTVNFTLLYYVVLRLVLPFECCKAIVEFRSYQSGMEGVTLYISSHVNKSNELRQQAVS